jgi:hemerythrin-like domain-containing protein
MVSESVELPRRSSDLVARVRREHATLRTLLDDVDRAGAAAKERRAGALDRLLRTVWELHVSFEEHLVMEEKLILPMLRRANLGEARAAALVAEHEQQRRVLLELVEDTERDTKDIDALVAQASELVASFRSDMTAEEAALVVLE